MSAAPSWPTTKEWTRRSLVGAMASAYLFGRGKEMPARTEKVLDPATEFELLRIGDPAYPAVLPYPENRAFTRRGDALYYASNFLGSMQVYRYDFKLNRLRTITEAQSLQPDSFTLTDRDRDLVYFNGAALHQVGAQGGREKLLFSLPAGFEQNVRVAVSEDGQTVLVAGADGMRTRLYNAMARQSGPLCEVDGAISNLAVNPKRAAYCLVNNGALLYAAVGEPKPIAAKTASGTVVSAQWSPDGAAVLYLVRPQEPNRLVELREVNLDTGADTLISRTTQFGHFQRNADGSVFLGASLSKASPHLLILLRAVRRELTLCEHKCSDAALTRAVFSPNAGRVAFQTDRSGRLALYTLAVDRIVDQGEEQAEEEERTRRRPAPATRVSPRYR